MQLKQTAMNLSRGKTAAIEAEVLPETASEKGVRYAIVSGPEIVTLHHDGTVTGKAVGTAKISVTSLDNPELVRYVTVSVTADFEPGQVIYQYTGQQPLVGVPCQGLYRGGCEGRCNDGGGRQRCGAAQGGALL